MPSYRPLALAAALLSSAARAQEGCYSAFSSSATYSAGAYVSAPTTKTVACDPAEENGCNTATCCNDVETSEGTVEVCSGCTKEVTEACNYQCTDVPNSQFCEQTGFEPGTSLNWQVAWNQLDCPCDGTAAAPAIEVPAEWSEGGCPAPYEQGTDYAPDDAVSVATTNGYTEVYACKAEPTNQFCGMEGYQPGTGQYWQIAWTLEGSCSGTLSPSSAVAADIPAWEGGGCPAPYVYEAGAEYATGEVVSVCDEDYCGVYACKSTQPANGKFCGMLQYEPGTGQYWEVAWTFEGSCSGTIGPTSSPSNVVLEDVGGCPAEWEAGDYDEGDRVSAEGLVFECKPWPYNLHCGQAGFEPLESPATPDAWKQAWIVMGFCSGTIAPTSAATIDPVDSLGACPKREYATGDEYGSGEQVKVCPEDAGNDCCYVYQCATDSPNPSGWCGLAGYEPGEGGGDLEHWKLAWSLEGVCCGTLGPTSSPTFDVLVDDGDGCPGPWTSGAEYEAGDEISYVVSSNPERKIKYRCKAYPNSLFCSQAAYAPGTALLQSYVTMAWDLVGSCSGTIAPTPSPTGKPTSPPTGKPTTAPPTPPPTTSPTAPFTCVGNDPPLILCAGQTLPCDGNNCSTDSCTSCQAGQDYCGEVADACDLVVPS